MSACINLKTGWFLNSFNSKAEARRYGKKIKKKHRKYVPYICIHCDKWHLRTKLNDEHYTVCNCKDHLGQNKRAYLDADELENVKNKINSRAGCVTVSVYDCPEYHNVWHLRGERRK